MDRYYILKNPNAKIIQKTSFQLFLQMDFYYQEKFVFTQEVILYDGQEVFSFEYKGAPTTYDKIIVKFQDKTISEKIFRYQPNVLRTNDNMNFEAPGLDWARIKEVYQRASALGATNLKINL
jgi:hypothetical protein